MAGGTKVHGESLPHSPPQTLIIVAYLRSPMARLPRRIALPYIFIYFPFLPLYLVTVFLYSPLHSSLDIDFCPVNCHLIHRFICIAPKGIFFSSICREYPYRCISLILLTSLLYFRIVLRVWFRNFSLLLHVMLVQRNLVSTVIDLLTSGKVQVQVSALYIKTGKYCL
jgi:hypothetical protein